MNILKILGIVAGIHVVAFFLMFVSPGCRSTSPHSTPTAADTAPPATVTPTPVPAPAEAAPGVSVNLAPPAAVRYPPTRPGTPASTALQNQPPEDVTPATTYTVAHGDSLTRIAHKFKTSVAELQRVNHLTSSSVLNVGQKLIIPGKAPASVPGAAGAAGGSSAPGTPGAGSETPAPGNVYVVKPGDTLAVIARRIGSTSAELKRYNNLRSDYVQVGQELKLPSGPVPAPAAAPAAPAVPAAAPASQPAEAASNRAASVKTPEGAVTHEVKPGETVGAIAKKYHVKTQDLLVANNIGDPKKIRPGQVLVIPGGGAAETATAPVAPSLAAPAGPAPAAAASASSSETSVQPPPAAAGQDLDAGLKTQGEVPVIKADDAGATKAP